MNVLLSVKPKYVDRILRGTKKYEFRKSNFTKDIDEVWIYATSPTKKIVGSFKIGTVLKDTPRKLWQNINGLSGLSEDEFFSFFNSDEIGYAFEIKSLYIFAQPVDPATIFTNFTAPQSFCYFDEGEIAITP